jgi:hypothetical protein
MSVRVTVLHRWHMHGMMTSCHDQSQARSMWGYQGLNEWLGVLQSLIMNRPIVTDDVLLPQVPLLYMHFL